MRKIYNWTILFGMILVIGGAVVVWTTFWNNLPSPFDNAVASGKNEKLLAIITPASSSVGSYHKNTNSAASPLVIVDESYAPASSSRDIDVLTSTPTATPPVIVEESYPTATLSGGSDVPNSTPSTAPPVVVYESYTPASSGGDIDVIYSTLTATPTVIVEESYPTATFSGGSDVPNSTPSAAPTVVPDENYNPTSTPQPQPVGMIPNRLVIPVIYLDAPIIPVGYEEITVGDQVYNQWLGPDQFAVGWHASSALLGLPGNTVLNGHHNAFGMVFKDLVKLGIGDVISVYSGSQEFRYQVVANLLLPESSEFLSTRIENARWIEPSVDARITLITCWPAYGNTHRVIIVAFPIVNPDNNPIP